MQLFQENWYSLHQFSIMDTLSSKLLLSSLQLSRLEPIEAIKAK